MATSGEKKKKETYVQAKTYFVSPFTPKWSSLPQEDMHFILNTIKDKLVSMGLKKEEIKVFRPWKKKKEKNPATTLECVPEVTQVAAVQDSPKNGWTNVAARRQLAIGINEVTKALERNELKLMLVCKSVKPKHMTDHLIALSATRDVQACQVPRLSQSMSEPLGLKSVLALGFRNCSSREDEAFADTVMAISPRIPPLDVRWLRGRAQSVKSDDPFHPEEKDGADATKKRGEKRKLESQPEVTESTSSSSLQPLTVKQTVPNPAKKRKTKAKS